VRVAWTTGGSQAWLGVASSTRATAQDDIEAGLADGRVRGTELRLRLVGATKRANQPGTWLVVKNPPI